MQRVNELFSKEVVRQTSGEKQGNVYDIVFDEESRNIVALLVGGMVGRGKVLRWTSVTSVGDVVVVGGEEALDKLGEDPEVANLHKKKHRVTGTEIVTQEGEKIGEVRDVFVNERGRVGGYEVSRGIVSDLRGRKFLPIENVQAIGKDTIIANNPDLLSVEEAEKARG
ncbi:MAG TPA: PRC-barrel domain-containing protein [Rubrobacteraceae bacterium]|nr:PRC-barrel domain-containing protein [Rubrobacteraceae bacterium]